MPNYKLQVEVIPQYLPEQSDPASDLYTFAYSITITNKGAILLRKSFQDLGA